MFPNEIYINIFQFIHHKEYSKIASLCTRFNEIMKTELLWKCWCENNNIPNVQNTTYMEIAKKKLERWEWNPDRKAKCIDISNGAYWTKPHTAYTKGVQTVQSITPLKNKFNIKLVDFIDIGNERSCLYLGIFPGDHKLSHLNVNKRAIGAIISTEITNVILWIYGKVYTEKTVKTSVRKDDIVGFEINYKKSNLIFKLNGSNLIKVHVDLNNKYYPTVHARYGTRIEII